MFLQGHYYGLMTDEVEIENGMRKEFAKTILSINRSESCFVQNFVGFSSQWLLLQNILTIFASRKILFLSYSFVFMTISPLHDPMGQAVLDYLKNGKAAAITVRSTIFDDDEMPVEHLFRTVAEMPLLERAALSYARGRVLDVGAGAGCHALALQQQVPDVVSIDVSPGCVEAMRLRGVQQVYLADFFTDDFGQDFDTVFMLMNGLGICGGVNELPVFFARLDTLLAPGGSVITDACDLSYIYEDEDGFLDLTGVEEYYGEVDYRMSYEAVEGEPFNWLYIDSETLMLEARKYNYEVEILRQDTSSTAYLARITKK